MHYKKADVAAGIVTFNPDIKRLQDNLIAVRDQVDIVFIVDNGSDNIVEIKKIITNEICLLAWNENKGIASALKAIMDFGIKHEYSWILTVDQDSIVKEGLIDKYLEYANKSECSNVAVFSCLRDDRNFKDKKHETQKKEIQIIDSCITSAAFCNVEKYKQIEGYDESFFIDCVDFDICYQFRDAGFDICSIKYSGLLHEVGHGENRIFLFWPIVVYHHNANRIYTLARNGVYLWKKHPKIYGFHRMMKKHLTLLTRILLYEDEKKKKLNAFLGGLIEGHKNDK